MSDEQKTKESEVFDQELSLDDLDAVAGGEGEAMAEILQALHEGLSGGEKDVDTSNCVQHDNRNIYGGGGFPNCAATVEDGSRCVRNDACYSNAVDYGDSLNDCSKAWR